MIEKIIKNIKKITKKYNNFLVCFSGGIDSTVLLYAIKNIKNINIRVIHINHNIHKLSSLWVKH